MKQASIWKRLLAWQLDLAIVFVGVAFVVHWLPLYWDQYWPSFDSRSNIGFSLALGSMVLIAFMPVTIFIAYKAAMECSRWQASLGQKCFGLKIMTLSGDRISFSNALIRNCLIYFSYVVFFVDCLRSIKHPNGVTWHDRFTETQSVDTGTPQLRYYKGVLIVWSIAFSSAGYRSQETKGYLTWLGDNVIPLEAENLQKLMDAIRFFDHCLSGIMYFQFAASVFFLLLFILNIVLATIETPAEKWFLKRSEALLALLPFLIMPLNFMINAFIAHGVVYFQNSLAISEM